MGFGRDLGHVDVDVDRFEAVFYEALHLGPVACKAVQRLRTI